MNIGEASKASGVSAKMIRYYESIDLTRRRPAATADIAITEPSDIYRLAFIRRARDLGFSIDQIRDFLGCGATATAAVRRSRRSHSSTSPNSSSARGTSMRWPRR